MYRGRRLRKNQVIRSMMKETVLTKRDLIYPLFVVEGENICREIETLPGVYHYSIDRLCEALDEMRGAQVLSCILFGIPNQRMPVALRRMHRMVSYRGRFALSSRMHRKSM